MPPANLVSLVVIVILPVIPAFLLFAALKSTGTLSGVWHGLNLRLGGAFAGYFAVLLLVVDTHPIWNPPPPYQVWMVKGQLVDADRRSPLDLANISSVPPCIQPRPNGEFIIYFYPTTRPDGKLDFPVLTLNPKDHESLEVPLDPTESDQVDPRVKITREGVLINLHSIPLRHVDLGAYSPSGAPPPRVDPSKELEETNR